MGSAGKAPSLACVAVIKSLSRKIEKASENNNRIFMVSASDSVPEKQLIVLGFPVAFV